MGHSGGGPSGAIFDVEFIGHREIGRPVATEGQRQRERQTGPGRPGRQASRCPKRSEATSDVVRPVAYLLHIAHSTLPRRLTTGAVHARTHARCTRCFWRSLTHSEHIYTTPHSLQSLSTCPVPVPTLPFDADARSLDGTQ